MLVASAAIGLIAPIGAQANDINIEGMNSYSSSKSSSKKQKFNSKTFSDQLAVTNTKLDVIEDKWYYKKISSLNSENFKTLIFSGN